MFLIISKVQDSENYKPVSKITKFIYAEIKFNFNRCPFWYQKKFLTYKKNKQ
jgi:hypothetical protein